jgi:hypothetical protein
MRFTTRKFYIGIVNEKYKTQFKDLINKIRAKENVLMQLHIKLEYASDPSIKNEKELDAKYFDFVTSSKSSNNFWRTPGEKQKPDEPKEFRNYRELANLLIKKLYKLISKNCREVHNLDSGGEKYPVLNEYFINASNRYNEHSVYFGHLMMQYFELIILFMRVINTRKLNNMNLFFYDFTFLGAGQFAELKKDEIDKCKRFITNGLELEQYLNSTDYKVKYIRDEEIAEIHRSYLQRHLEYIEQRISEVLQEIKAEMDKKNIVLTTLY